MPELPEVERGRKLAEENLKSKTITHVTVANDSIVYRNIKPSIFAKKIVNQKIYSVHRKGKYIWFDLGLDYFPIFHFGMKGDFKTFTDLKPKYTKIILTLNDGLKFTMVDARRFGRIFWVHDILNTPPICKLGPDPITDKLDLTNFTQSLMKRKTNLKALLLNQAFISGIGNWIADDVLYRAKLSPLRIANTLSNPEIKKLRDSILYIIEKAVSVNADSDQFPKNWLFHIRWKNRASAREHRKSANLDGIHFDEVAGRSTVWKPAIQK